jgi:Ni,Fe-hydrogenase I small subunit
MALPRNTTFNAETAEAAEKNPSKALRSLRALRSHVVISFNPVCPAQDDSVVNPVQLLTVPSIVTAAALSGSSDIIVA